MKIAFIIFDQMTALDLIGFYDPITRLNSMNLLRDVGWVLCSNRQQACDDRGLVVMADCVGEPLADYDMLFVPGGRGTRTLQHDRAFLGWLRSAAAVPLKISVCTGALLLGAAGFLKDRRATTHPRALADLEPYCREVVGDRIVDEGGIITAGGVAASIDLGLYVVGKLAGDSARLQVAERMDYPYGSRLRR
jgi:cyclohexyl-isocyanide hydratase